MNLNGQTKYKAFLELKNKLLKETGGRCAYCGKVLKDDFHIDHILCKNLYSSFFDVDDEKNLTVACKHCNCQKSNKPLTNWLNFYKNKYGLAFCDPREIWALNFRIAYKVEKLCFFEKALIHRLAIRYTL